MIEELIQQFLQINGAATGRGPRHPERPDGSAETEIHSLFNTYPLLRRDPCYRDFLEIYSGAVIERSMSDRVDISISDRVDILGFGNVSLGLEDEDPVTEDSFFVFAICAYRRDTEQQSYAYEYDFAFDISGTRKAGIYRAMSTLDQRAALVWYTADFCSWLEELIQKGGVYERPSFS